MTPFPVDLVPTSYELDEEARALRISWSDGHESLHPYEMLRRMCPCALCAGEGSFKGTMTPDTPLTAEMTTLYELVMVGRYGLTPIWEDGHKTGIYTYERLRGNCMCDECRQERGEL